VLCTQDIAGRFGTGDLGSTFGGGPIAAAAIAATIQAVLAEHLLANVRAREAQIRERCIVGPVRCIQGMGLLLGLVCDRPAVDVRNALLEHDILTGTSSDPEVLRILAPLVLQDHHVDHLTQALASIPPATAAE
jgi:acetylornithine/succinyldiaminopimelate/putrescine aminotransferase